MAYNIRGKTLSTVIPASLYNKYPNFVTFLDKYYDWSRKSILYLNNAQGNLNLSSKFYGMTSEFYVDREVTNTLDKSYTVDFDGQRTYLPTEKFIGVRPLTSPLTLTIGTARDYVFEKISNPKLTFYYDQQYKITNSTGATVYIKDQQTIGSGDQYTTGVTTDGTTTTITTTSATPRLYYTVDGYDGIGIIDVEAVPADYSYDVLNVINTTEPDAGGYTNSVYGFGRIQNILFNPDYLVDTFDTLTTRDTPDAFYYKYLESYGLGELFSKTIRNRSSADDFVRFLNSKGTPSATKFFFNAFFQKDVEISFPGENMIKSSVGDYFVKQKMILTSTKPLELTRNRRLKGNDSGAYVTIESVLYNAPNDYYEVFINDSTIDGTFLIGESILVLDNTDAAIEYDIEGILKGIFTKADITQPGIEYDKGEVISNTYTIEGLSKTIGFTVDDITTTGIEDTTITSGGTNYVVGDRLHYPKPTERVEFSATINATGQSSPISFTGPNNEYTYAAGVTPSIKITLEDDAKNTTLFTTDSDTYNSCLVEIGGIQYTATDIVEATPDVLTLPAIATGETLTIQAGQLIRVTIAAAKIVDRLTDTSFFDTTAGVVNTAATGYVSRVHATTGAIEEIKIDNAGAGYRKRPTTTSGITIITDGKTLTHPSLVGTAASKSTVTHPTHNSITHSAEAGFIVGEEITGDVSGASGIAIKETSNTSLQVTGVAEENQFSTSDTITGQVSGATATVSAVVGSFGKGETITGTNVALTISGGTTFPVGNVLNQTVLTHADHSGSAFTAGTIISQDTTNAAGVVVASTADVTHVRDLGLGTWGTSTDVVTVRTLTHLAHTGNAFTVGETLTQAASGTDPTGVVVTANADFTEFRDLGTATWNATDNVTGGTSSITLSASHLSAVSSAGVTLAAGHLTAVTIGKGTVAYSDSINTVLKDVTGSFVASSGLDDYETVAVENATISAIVTGSTGTVQSHDGLQTLITNGSLPVGAAIEDAAGTPATATIVSVDGDEYELTHPSSGITAFTVGSTITQGSATGIVKAGGDADKTIFQNLGTATWTNSTNVTQSSPSSITLTAAHLTRVTFRSGTSVLTHPGGGTFTVGETITQATTGATGTVQSGSSNDETIFKDLNSAAWVDDENVTGGTSAVTVSSGDIDAVVIGSSTIVIKEASKIFSVGNVTATSQTVAARTITATTNKTMLVAPATGRFVAGDIITGGTTGAVTELSTIDSLFTIGETVTQASSGATGKVVSTADTRMTVTNVSGTFNTSNIVTGALSDMSTTPSAVTTGASANLTSLGENFGGAKSVSITTEVIGVTTESTVNLTRSDVADGTNNNAEVILRSGYYRDYGKIFNDVTGYLSETSQKITDSYRYQDFSYAIKSDLNYKDFAYLLKKLAHPAGMIFFNDFFIVKSFQQKLNNGVSTATKEITINIHKTSTTKFSHSEQTFTVGRKLTGSTSGATGIVKAKHNKLLTTLDRVNGTFVAGETVTEEISNNTATTAPVVLTHPDHSGSAFTVGGTISQVTTNASGTVSVASTDSTSIVDLALGTWGTSTNVVAARTLTHSNHDKAAFTVGETLTQASTSATGYVISSTVDATIFRDLGGGTWGTANNVTGGSSSIVLTAANLSAVSAAGVTLTAAHLDKASTTSGVDIIDKLDLIFSASSLSAIIDYFVRYNAQRPFDDQFQWLNESVASFGNYIGTIGSEVYNNSNVISTYADVQINEKSIIKRDGVKSTPFENFRQTERIKTVTGTGTVGFADTTTVSSSGPPGPVITVTGGSSDFINQCSPRDIITAGSHKLLVVAVASDTSLTAQRVSVAGSTGTVSGQSFTIEQKRINELNNATFDDLIQHGYDTTIQDVNRQFLSGSELTMDQFKDVFAV